MATMHRTRRVAIAAFATAALAIGLAACTSSNEPKAEPTETPVASATPTASPTPEPTTPAAALATCDTVLTEAGYADLAGSNLSARDFTAQSWDYPLLHTMANDGVVCLWGNSGDVMVVLGQLAMDQTTWDTTRAQLEAEGYVAQDATVAGFMDGPDATDDDSYPGRGFVHRDGILYYSSYSDFLHFVGAFQS